MMKFSTYQLYFALLVSFLITQQDTQAQVYPFADGFESYNNFSTLGTQGGYLSDMSVYQTHGMGNSTKGLMAQMSNFNLYDSTVTPLIGPLTSSAQVSFFYRVMETGSSYPYIPAYMYAGDSIMIYIGSQTLNNYQLAYSITNSNLVVDTAFKRIKITPPAGYTGLNGNIKIVVKHTSNNNSFFVDIDSLSVRDSVPTLAALSASVQKTNATCHGTCNGTVTINAVGGTPGYTYTWDRSLPAGKTQNSLCAGTYHYTVSDGGSSSLSDSVIITEPAALVAQITADAQVFCSSDSVRICATAGFASYSWNNNPSTSACILVKAAGNYYVTVTDNSNCTAESNRVSLTVYPTTSISLTVYGDTLTAFNGSTYQWYKDGQPINGATGSRYIATASGSYSVEISDANGCYARSSEVPLVISGIKEEIQTNWAISPNPLPTGATWQIKVPASLLDSQLEVYDASGRRVYQTIITNPHLNLKPDFNTGVYIVTIRSVHGTFNQKLIQL